MLLVESEQEPRLVQESAVVVEPVKAVHITEPALLSVPNIPRELVLRLAAAGRDKVPERALGWALVLLALEPVQQAWQELVPERQEQVRARPVVA